VGCAINLNAAFAPASPVSAKATKRALRLDANAISDMANSPLSKVKKTISKTSITISYMALYLIGDVQGCDEALERLLTHIAFSPSRDTLYLLGDLVNRGPNNAEVLRRLMGLGSSAQCLLGNHDLHLLAVSLGVRQANRQDTTQDILTAPDSDALLHWLRHQHMAMQVGQVLMVHAGVLPQWRAQQTMALAGEVEAVLRSNDWVQFMPQMYGSLPNVWHDDLAGADRLRVIVNALTRLRFCDAQGAMDFSVKEGADKAPVHLMPWFDVPGRLTADTRIAFGHWSTVQIADRADVVCLDDGCVWGGCLSAAKLEIQDTLFSVADAPAWERVSIRCPQTMDPLA
jgi:bis(5'-nucleosyl)-tetraphosphatase (symmetrical)